MADYDYTAIVNNFTDDVNDDFTISVSAEIGTPAVPLDLTGWTVEGHIYNTQPADANTGADQTPDYPLPDYEFTATGTTTRLLTLTRAEKEAMGVGTWWYKVQITNTPGDDKTYRLMHGNLTWRG